MKLMSLFSLLFVFQSTAQQNYFLEYRIANVLPEYDVILDNTLCLGIKKNKTLLSIGMGREDWFLNYYNNKSFTNPTIYNSHCRTYKFSTLLEHQFFLIKSKLSLNLGIGGKIYFFNQMKDSLSVGIYNYFDTYKPSYLQNAKNNNIDPLNGEALDDHAFIRRVPYAFSTNLAFQYSFKKWAISVYYQLSMLQIKSETVKSLTARSNYAFYYNLGLGINYPLNFKKKEQKITGIE